MNNSPEIPLAESLAGSWLVVHHTFKKSDFSYENKQQGLVTQWGGHYIHSLVISTDGSFSINDSYSKPAYGCDHGPIGGTWMIQGKQVVFHWKNAPPTSFEATITKSGMLRLENKDLELTHTKKF